MTTGKDDEADFSGLLVFPKEEASSPKNESPGQQTAPSATETPPLAPGPNPTPSLKLPSPARMPLPRAPGIGTPASGTPGRPVPSPEGAKPQSARPRPAGQKPRGPVGFDESEIEAALMSLSDAPPPLEAGSWSSIPPSRVEAPRAVPAVRPPTQAKSAPAVPRKSSVAPPPLPSRKSSVAPPLPQQSSAAPPLPPQKSTAAPPLPKQSNAAPPPLPTKTSGVPKIPRIEPPRPASTPRMPKVDPSEAPTLQDGEADARVAEDLWDDDDRITTVPDEGYSPERFAEAALAAEEAALPSTLRPDREPTEPPPTAPRPNAPTPPLGGPDLAEAAVEVSTASLEDLAELERIIAAEEAEQAALVAVAESASVDEAPNGDYRPAAARLSDHQLTDAWASRADWFEEEALATTDAGAKARLLLAASELRAMSGDTTRGRALAKQAGQAEPSMVLAARQLRSLAALEGDFKTVATALDLELRSAPDEASRAHAAYMASEIHRLHLSDRHNADRRLDLVTRAVAHDPRPVLMKIASMLSGKEPASGPAWPEQPELSELSKAASELALVRGWTKHAPIDGPTTTAVAFHEARRALADRNPGRAGALLKDVARVPELGDASRLLAAALLAHQRETATLAIDLLSSLRDELPLPAVRRALAARALERGDARAMTHALSERPDEEAAFGVADRVALAALSGSDRETLAAAFAALQGRVDLRPLAAAASAALGEERIPVGDPLAQAELALGRALGAAKEIRALKDDVQALRTAEPGSAIGEVLALELAAAASETSTVIAELFRLAGDDRSPQGHLCAALLAEAVGLGEDAKRHYAAVLDSSALAEAGVRALTSPGDASGSTLLSMLSASFGDEKTIRQALLLYEAAIRHDPEQQETVMDFLLRSHDAAPDVPFAARLGSDLSRSAGDANGLLEWIRRQRAAARDPFGRALHLVREALLIADDEPATAAARVGEALEAHPADAALHELSERLDDTASPARGQWREELASKTTDARTKAWLFAGAARAYQRAGAFELAARAAEQAALHGGSELSSVTATRLSANQTSAPPGSLAEARALEQSLLGKQGEELESVAARLSDLVADAREAGAHARLAARLRMQRDTWESARDYVVRAAKHESPSLWTLRRSSAYGEEAGDSESVLAANRALAARTERPLDAGILSLRAAEAAERLGRTEEAIGLASAAVEAFPGHLIARNLRARLLESQGDRVGAAEDLEAIASNAAVPDHRFEAWYRAALLFLDDEKTLPRGVAALEHAAEIDVTRADVFDRLRQIYVASGDQKKLADLLEQRLRSVTDDAERLSLELVRGRALAEMGDMDSARRALEAALQTNPNHPEALELTADLSVRAFDWKAAEDAWMRLVLAVEAPEKQSEIYGRLGRLYEVDLPNPERAEICYREILKRFPDDARAHEGLVRGYVRAGDVIKAVETQTLLVDRAATPEEKRDRTLRLAAVYDEAAKDKKSSSAILDKARKAWPHDAAVLRATVEHHKRHEETAAATVLLDRAAAEARRALAHGRFDPAFFAILRTTAELKGQTDAAVVAAATLAALEGREEGIIRGAGTKAADPSLDDLLAPELLSSAFRSLLHRLSGAIEAAYPVDPRALRASTLDPSSSLAEQIRTIASAIGLPSLELLVGPTLGTSIMPASSSTPRLVLGQGLLKSNDEPAREFAIFRALALLRTRAAVFTRLPAIELWPVTAALLRLLAPSFQPQAVDTARLADAEHKLRATLPERRDDDLPTLALEVAGTIGNRASQIGQAASQWASRMALLSAGSPAVSLRGVALSLSQADRVPADPAERLKWIVRQPEARDIAVFSVSDAYAEARKRMGLSN